jgi:hypothetical protein
LSETDKLCTCGTDVCSPGNSTQDNNWCDGNKCHSYKECDPYDGYTPVDLPPCVCGSAIGPADLCLKDGESCDRAAGTCLATPKVPVPGPCSSQDGTKSISYPCYCPYMTNPFPGGHVCTDSNTACDNSTSYCT